VTWELVTEPLRAHASDHTRVRRFGLRVEDGADRDVELTSSTDRVVIGTGEGVDLRLTDRAASRYHCELAIGERGVVVTDLGSKNGTMVDGVQVEKAYLRPGALIGVGRTRIRFDLGTDHAQIPLARDARYGMLVGRAPAMRAAFLQLERAAATDATVLVIGETGTGKELAAESLHREGKRRDAPFLVVDCGAVPPDLLEAELFGHIQGAFTDAKTARAGVFEAADGGTVFLDEIGELELALQPKLLRVLDKREVKRVGATQHQPVDVRVVAATNRDLRAEVNAGRFRADLYYRLAVVQIRMPALRERADDLPLLVDRLLGDIGGDATVHDSLRTPAFIEHLAAHTWPGNVRELRNYLERCIVMRGPLPVGADDGATTGPALVADAAEPYKVARDRWMRTFERAYLVDLLQRHENNVAVAARAAGIDRVHLYRLLWRHGLK
jgi:DNA-binding NtrC family response regulator